MPPNNVTSTSKSQAIPLLKAPAWSDGESPLDTPWARLLVVVALVTMVASVMFLLGRRRPRPLYGKVPKEAPPRLNLTEDDDDDEEELFNATQHKLLRKSNITDE